MDIPARRFEGYDQQTDKTINWHPDRRNVVPNTIAEITLYRVSVLNKFNCRMKAFETTCIYCMCIAFHSDSFITVPQRNIFFK